MRKLSLLTIILSVLLIVPPIVLAKWHNICPADPSNLYCKDVGKNAYNNHTNPPLLRGIEVGKIIGVAWRPKGSVILIEPAIPKAGLSQRIWLSPRDAFYYIINGRGKPFLRQCREIDARY